MSNKLKRNQINTGGKPNQLPYFAVLSPDEHGIQIQDSDDNVLMEIAISEDQYDAFSLRITDPGENAGLYIEGDEYGASNFELTSTEASTISSIVSLLLDAPLIITNASQWNFTGNTLLNQLGQIAWSAQTLTLDAYDDIDFDNKKIGILTIDADESISSISGILAGSESILIVEQDNYGQWNITNWPSNVVWLNGFAPDVSLPDGEKFFVFIYYDGVNYYAHYIDNTKFDKNINYIRAEQIGNDLNISGIGNVSMAALNGADVAFADAINDDLRTYRFDGTDWSQVGNDLNISGMSTPAIAALNDTDIAFIDDSNEDLRTYRFDGTNWSQVGNDLNITGMGLMSIAALNGTDIAILDGGNDDLITYRFDGSDWSQIGNPLSISGAGFSSITALNSTDIAAIDVSNLNLTTYRFDGSDWVQIGNSLNLSVTDSPRVAALNDTDIVLFGVDEDLRTYRFDGTDWSQIGNGVGISGAGGASLAAINGIEIAFIDVTNQDLRTYRFVFYIGNGPHGPAG